MLSIHNNFNLANLSRTMRSNTRAQSSVMEKLASGYRINAAKDDPSGLIISERLRSQIEGIERAIQNSTETDNVLGILEGSLTEVSSVLRNMKNLAIESANTGVVSKDMIAANQAELDCGLNALERILESARYGGKKIASIMQENGTLPGTPLSSEQTAALQGLGKNGPFFIDKDKLLQLGENGVVGVKDGKLTGEKTFVLAGMGKDGSALEVEFKEGASMDDVLAELRDIHAEHPDTAPATDTPDRSVLEISAGDLSGLFDKGTLLDHSQAHRIGTDPDEVILTRDFLGDIASLPDDDATERLTSYINSFVPILGLDDTDLSDEDKALLSLATDLQDLNLDSLGQVSGPSYRDENGNLVADTLSLRDLYSGSAASLDKDPLLAMKVLDKANKDILAQRANIGAVRALSSHERDAWATTHENLTRMESLVRDTDMAQEMVEFSRVQIATQSGSRMFQAVREQTQGIIDLIS